MALGQHPAVRGAHSDTTQCLESFLGLMEVGIDSA